MVRFTVFFDGNSQNSYVLDEPVITIGRLPENTISIPHMGISRRHVRIEEDADRKFVLTDLNSLNGTLVNGKKEKKIALRSGDTIQIGKFSITYEELAPGTPAEPPPRTSAPRQLPDEGPRSQTRENVALQRITDEKGPVLIDTAQHLAYALDKPYLTVGSGAGDDIPCAGFLIGEQQAFVELESDGWYIGTTKLMGKLKINGHGVKRHRLKHKDRIDLGAVSFRFMENG